MYSVEVSSSFGEGIKTVFEACYSDALFFKDLRIGLSMQVL